MVDWLSPAIILPELHVVIGALAVAAAYTFAPGSPGDPRRPRPWAPRAVVAVFVGIVLLKESLWDPANEIDQPFLWAGAGDLFFYLVGIGAMLLAVGVRFRRL